MCLLVISAHKSPNQNSKTSQNQKYGFATAEQKSQDSTKLFPEKAGEGKERERDIERK